MGADDSTRLQSLDERTYDLVDRLGKMEGAVKGVATGLQEVKMSMANINKAVWGLAAAVVGAIVTTLASSLFFHHP